MRRAGVLVVGPVLLLAGACGDHGGDESGRPVVVVTTSILGDVVGELVGDAAEVVTVLPAGTDPHDFQPSARDAAKMRSADVLVVNGAGLEAGLATVVAGAAAEGVDVYAAIDPVDVLTDGREVDPHFFTDPARMVVAARALADHLVDVVAALDTPAVGDRVESYLRSLGALDAEVERTLASVPADRRALVTGHRSMTYFADRYDFDIAGVLVPGGSAGGVVSAGDLAELATRLAASGLAAVFVDASSGTRVADALAAEADLRVVELYTESLGPAGSSATSYVDMIRTDARRIAEVLTP